jgi:hypothetical protein
MSRTIPPADPESTASRASRWLRDAGIRCAHHRLDSRAVRRSQRAARQRSQRESTQPSGRASGSGFMRGIVRGMDAAPEAHMDVFTAVPRMKPEPEALAASNER